MQYENIYCTVGRRRKSLALSFGRRYKNGESIYIFGPLPADALTSRLQELWLNLGDAA